MGCIKVSENSVLPTRTPEPPHRGQVLVVDDAPLNQKILSEILAPDGYSLTFANDGEAGLTLAREIKPDLVLLDLVLPGIMGIEVLDALKREQPTTIVILTTAYGSEETAIQAMRRGVNDYIINKRPFDADEVREVVRRAITEAHLRQENRRLNEELTQANEQLQTKAGNLEHLVKELSEANDKLQELDKAKASFFSMISHELRHPITVTKGYLELVTESNSPLDADTRGYLQVAEQNMKNLAEMVDDLLDLSRIEAGFYRVDRQPLQVSGLINQARLAYSSAAASKGVSISIQDTNELPLVFADPLRLAQVLSNLIENAIKFTPQDGAVILSGRDDAHEVELIVSDTGIGIPADELDKIFDRFYQIQSADYTDHAGSGLGLAICREIIRLHGGRIWADSELGQGSHFHITLAKATDEQ
jgi:signal transduction histidine kinase